MSKVINLKRGLDINLSGKAAKVIEKSIPPDSYALKPTDFPGITPRLLVKPDDEVKAGSPLFCDKTRPEILFTAPVSGKVFTINRGERRLILEVVIQPDGKERFEDFGSADPLAQTRSSVISKLLQSGCWPFLIQRPFGIIANPEDQPKAIFISGFDSAPLAPDIEFMLEAEKSHFQAGINALSKLSPRIHLGLHANQSKGWLSQTQGVDIHYFSGPHPAGNVGVQIHHVSPINKGELVWTIKPADVVIIGKLFQTGHFDPTRIVALAGSEVNAPKYYQTRLGACIFPLVENQVKTGDLRYISGNVLTGKQINRKSYLGFYDSAITVIPEGNFYEMFGWALPGFGKFSVSRTYFSWLTPKAQFRIDTNYHGGERAFVLTGQYDKVLPMDILPVYLVKACIIEDIDQMEQLGIYEVLEEDMALCEFVCSSKVEVQSLIRKGLDLIRKEMA